MRRLRAVLALPWATLAVFTAAKSFRDNPVIGSPTLNRWGLHVARRRAATALGRARRRRLAGLVTAAERAELADQGFVVKRDFLDAATFTAFRSEIMRLAVPAREALIGDTLTRLIALDGPTLRRLPTAGRVLTGARYRGLVNYVGSFRRRPSLYVQTVFSRYAPDNDPDIQSFYHVDTFHPTVKAWLFLDDVGDDGAPFTYVPGSHIANRRRLAWERRASIGARRAADPLTAEGSFRIGEAEIRRLGYPAPMELPVAANTLIVADTSGIHRRGVARFASRRISVWAYSRSNPFLPWTGGDVTALPILRDHAQRLYWMVSDRLKTTSRPTPGWRWVGIRSPLTPP